MRADKAEGILNKLNSYPEMKKLDINWKGDIVNRTGFLGKNWRALKKKLGVDVEGDVKKRIQECFDSAKKGNYKELKTKLINAKLYATSSQETPEKKVTFAAEDILINPKSSPEKLFFKSPEFLENHPAFNEPISIKSSALIEKVPYNQCQIHEQKAFFLQRALSRLQPANSKARIQAAKLALDLAVAMRPVRTMKDGKEAVIEPLKVNFGNSETSRHEVSNVYRALMQFALNGNLEEEIEDAAQKDVPKIKIKAIFSRITQERSDFSETAEMFEDDNHGLHALSLSMQKIREFAKLQLK